jgi:uncharacterized SAM-binding protein YcdF (DUF218 family)
MKNPNREKGTGAVEVAVVPGAAVKKGGVPGLALSGRIDRAVALFHAGEVQNILVSGGVGKHPPSEAEVMRDIAIEKGVPEERIFLETRSASTLENARECAEIIGRNSWKKVVLVTDRYHAPRARFLFRVFGVEVSTCFSETEPSEGRGGRGLFLLSRECAALAWNFLKLAVLYISRKL